jgi:hypothetical protein
MDTHTEREKKQRSEKISLMKSTSMAAEKRSSSTQSTTLELRGEKQKAFWTED